MDVSTYVAIGDSFTEGKGDSHPDGSPRGFADLLAASLSSLNAELRYANLARPSVRAREIARDQVPALAELRPDLVTVNCGINDVIALGFDESDLRRAVDDVLHGVRTAAPDARILALTLPDITHLSLVARLARHRIRVLDDMIREAAAAVGAEVADLSTGIPMTTDELALDRVHPSPVGHLRFAGLLSRHLGVPPPAPDHMAARPRGQALLRAWRTATVAPTFIRKRLAREQRIAAQPAKRPQALPL